MSAEVAAAEKKASGSVEQQAVKDASVVDSQQPPSSAIPKELLVKHPLQYRWVLWYLKNDRTKNWEDCLKEVATFDTVEDFWALASVPVCLGLRQLRPGQLLPWKIVADRHLYNHTQLASGLSWGCDYYLFKEGIRPMWEDEHNVEGGRWLIQVSKDRRNEIIDHYWLELLMSMIGEQFEDLGEEICGAVVNIRNKGDKVSLWTRNSEIGEEALKKIGGILKTKLGIEDPLRYEAHKDTSHKTSSSVKSKLVV